MIGFWNTDFRNFRNFLNFNWGGMVKIWNADDADLLWQNAVGDGFAKAKADGDGF